MSHAAPDEANALRHLYLIDGSGFVFRAFHALPPLTRPDGTPVNAVLGFTNMLWKILRETDADHVAVIFDSGRHTFRNDLYEPYKANRGETPEELIPQFPLVREAAGAFNLAAVELAGFEADDLIAAYAEAATAQGGRVTIVSADKDLMQLVEGESVVMYDYFKNREIGPDQVHERFGVGPERVIDVQALAGDSTDNVPGVPGIGVKTAALLINDYGDLDRLLRPCRGDQAAQAAPESDRPCRDGAPPPAPWSRCAGIRPCRCRWRRSPGASRSRARSAPSCRRERLQVVRGPARRGGWRGGAGGGGRRGGRDGPPARLLPAGERRAGARGMGGEGTAQRLCWRWSPSWRRGRRKAPALSASRSPRRRVRPATCRSATPAPTCWGRRSRFRRCPSPRRWRSSPRC